MTRTQLSFDAEQLQGARDRAAQLGISLAEYVRRLVAEDLGEGGRQPSPDSVFDLGASSGRSNVAANKDAMIGEALAGVRR